MRPDNIRSRLLRRTRPGLLAIGCAAMLAPGTGMVFAQEPATAAAPAASAPANAAPDTTKAAAEAKIPAEQLDSLVAPIALYPDALLAQTLVASTYPLELIQLQQWLAKNPDLKDQALADAVAQQPWDPSIQSMAAIPDVVKRLADDIQWTTDLGNAFLAQQQDVMDAVQRMRKKAKDNGALESNEQQVVKTETVEKTTVIIVESSDPEVIYVPVYTPTVVYGPPIYAYPPIYYPPPPPPGAAFVAFSVGFMWGAAWGGSCCGCGWHGGGDIYINNSNNFNQINHYGGGGNNNWNHNPQHRGGAPYANQTTANKYGGSSRGAGVSNTAAGGAANRGGSAGVSNNAAGGAANRGGSAGVSNKAAGGAANKGGSAARPSGGDKVGNQSVPKNSPSKSGGSLSGGSSGYNGNAARAQSSRGASSGGGRSGGGSRGGGGRR